jgi:nitrogen fixation protein FixH
VPGSVVMANRIMTMLTLMTTAKNATVVISVNMVMMRFAITTLPGTEVDSAYSASLAYQREILAARQQNERGWQVQAHIERRPDGAAAVAIEARDHAGAPLAGLNFLARLQRPTDRRADRAIEVTEAGSGSFHGRAEGISAGQWDLVIEGDAEGRRMFLSKNRVVLN